MATAGILDGDASSALRSNTAKGNGGNGIDAAAGVTDMGGNRASGNTTDPQCVNIACS